MPRWLRFVCALTLAVATAAVAQTRDAMTHFFQASFGDLKEELELARKEGKRGLFIMFAAEDCPPCIAMKKNVFSQVTVQDYYRRHFRVLHVDFNGDDEMTDFNGRSMRSKEFARSVARVRGTPTVLIVDTAGKELVRHAGLLRDANEALHFADFVLRNHYQRVAFETYWRERGGTMSRR
ncbi:MAG: thioredoxin fold domain-containing protein [Burkholderiaceae bacterium]|nr:thioredoxin fold domain-containing protein [Burkholderiaceae bacterium]